MDVQPSGSSGEVARSTNRMIARAIPPSAKITPRALTTRSARVPDERTMRQKWENRLKTVYPDARPPSSRSVTSVSANPLAIQPIAISRYTPEPA